MSSYTLLVPVDADKDRAQAQVEYVTSIPDAAVSVRVVLLYVYSTIDGGDSGKERLRDHMEQPDSVTTTQKQLTDEDIEVEIKEKEGEIAETILTVARELQPNGIVLAGRKRSPVGKAIFGSVTQKVILNADFPVTVID